MHMPKLRKAEGPKSDVTPKEKTPTKAEMLAEIDRKITEVLEERVKDENIRGYVINRVEQQMNKIIASTLGMTDEWGRLKVDNCNARQSAITQNVGTVALGLVQKSFQAWFDENFKDGKLPVEWEDAIRAEVREQLRYKVGMVVDEQVKSRVGALCTNIIEDELNRFRLGVETPK